jgi:hypothetical protein
MVMAMTMTQAINFGAVFSNTKLNDLSFLKLFQATVGSNQVTSFVLKS